MHAQLKGILIYIYIYIYTNHSSAVLDTQMLTHTLNIYIYIYEYISECQK